MDKLNPKKRAQDSEFLPEDEAKRMANNESVERKDGVDANEVIFFRIITDSSEMITTNSQTFKPFYTNQIFGEDELIFGYKDLNIMINFTTSNFFANIDITYSEKNDNCDDLLALFDKVFPGGYETDKTAFMKLLPNEKSFKPFGKLVNSFILNEVSYEIFLCDFSMEGFAEYSRRLQTILIFFINGASFIEEDDNWKIFILYSRSNERYNLAGFSTVYSFFQGLEKCRNRISQFIILPPFQRKGLGLYLISEIYKNAINDKYCFEITVEDASIEFQFLRDCKDFEILMKEEIFDWVKNYKGRFTRSLYIESEKAVDRKIVSHLQKKYKITKNQIKRVIEIMKFIHLDINDEAFPLFKKTVQERLRQANKAEFYPFIKKKIPYVVFDGFQAIINPSLYKNSNENEIKAKLEEYFEEIISQYTEIKPRILKIFSNK